jgi:hypothetical protein
VLCSVRAVWPKSTGLWITTLRIPAIVASALVVLGFAAEMLNPVTVDALTLYGALAVTAMLIFYALESRSAIFVLAFAVACAASSLYGFLQGAWPFGVVEAIWCVVAVRRWWQRRKLEAGGPLEAIAHREVDAHAAADVRPLTR